MTVRCAWCSGPPGSFAPCDECGLVLCDSCTEDAVAEMERRSLPEAASCPFCHEVLPLLPDLVDFVCGDLRVSPDELADLWWEAKREDL